MFDIMSAISINYTSLDSEVLIKIFQLADIMGVTPKVAAEAYIKLKLKSNVHRKEKAS
jgi:hypothetical protein